MASYIGTNPPQQTGIVNRFQFTATGGQTVFTGADNNGDTLFYISSNPTLVFLNGVQLVVNTDYTQTDNDTITLATGATLNDELEVMGFGSFDLNNAATTRSQLGLGTAAVENVGTSASNVVQLNGSAQLPAVDGSNLTGIATDVVDDTSPQLGGNLDGNGNTINLTANTTSFGVPSGTTAQQPTASSTEGHIRYDTDDNVLYYSDGSTWLKVSSQIPTLTSVSGTIFETIASTLTLTGTNFLTTNLTVTFTRSGTDYTQTVTPSSGTSATVTTPSGLNSVTTAGDTITIKVTNDDNQTSDTQSVTVTALPSGGTISNSGNYRIHTFNSSGTFTNTLPNLSAEYLIIAGGGAGGNNDGGQDQSGGSGGGGAGGYRSGTTTVTSATGYTVTVGAGGSGGSANGSSSSFNSITSTGGGGGGQVASDIGNAGNSGGSGGGAGADDLGNNISGGSGTAGQGNNGADTDTYPGGAGGGGAGGTGNSSLDLGQQGGSGGNGSASSITGSSVTRAGGGGGGCGASAAAAPGGSGGGGAGASRNTSDAVAGTVNTGSGGGGGCDTNVGSEQSGANGGSGVVIIRYDTTSL